MAHELPTISCFTDLLIRLPMLISCFPNSRFAINSRR
jgi:hypothetical protein